MKNRIRKVGVNLWRVTKTTFKEYVKDQPAIMNYSATIAFYTIFSLPATLLFIATIAGLVYEEDVAKGELFSKLSEYLGPKNAMLTKNVMSNINNNHSGKIATAIGTAVLVFSTTTVFITIQNALNHIWGVRMKKGRSFMNYLKLVIYRLLSFIMVGSLGLLVVVSILANTLIRLFAEILESFISSYTVNIMQIITYSVSVSVMALGVSILLKVLPAAKIHFRDAFIGGVITALLFNLGKYLIEIYILNSPLSTTYGAAGSFVIFLIWIYFSAAIFLFGAEFTFVYTQMFGQSMIPKSNAESILNKT